MEKLNHIDSIPRAASTALIEDQVQDSDGDKLGHIEELIVDANDGKIVSALITMTRDQPLRHRVMVPWSDLHLDRLNHCWVLDDIPVPARPFDNTRSYHAHA